MKIPLQGGFYQATSIIADAQSCVNLYPERNPPDAPYPYTHYLSPGLTLLSAAPSSGVSRGVYTASNGTLYRVIGNAVYSVSNLWVHTQIGTLTTSAGMCSFSDNTLAMIICDGTINALAVNLPDNTSGTISPINFYPCDKVDYIDTFFVFNYKGTQIFFSSLSEVTYTALLDGSAFYALDFAAKSGYSDLLTSLIVMHQEIWLIGQKYTELWYNAGLAPFSFAQLPQGILESGSGALYSVCQYETNVFFLSQNLQGQAIVIKGLGYATKRISTHALENIFASYSTITDCISYIYQQNGHTFLVLNFPSADATWVWDDSQELWHQRAWLDSNGNLHRHRVNCAAVAYGVVVGGDWQNGNLYSFDPNNYTDNSQPITRIRSFPHLVDNANRISHKSFIADMDVGQDLGADGSSSIAPPQISLSWSDNKGATYGQQVMQSLGATGQYDTNIKWNRLGLARDRVYKLIWSINAKTALNGAYIEVEELKT